MYNMVKKKKERNLIAGKEDKQLMWMLIIAGAIFALFLGGYFYAQSLNHFDYAGVRWDKTKEGQMNFFYSKFRLADNPPAYNAYLRNDPRKNNVTVNATFKFANKIFVSFEDYNPECQGKDAYLAAVISPFISAMGLNATGTITNKTRAKEQNRTFADCNNATIAHSVIVIQSSDTPSIVQSAENANCYYFNVGKCQQIETVERFIVAVLGQTSGEKI